MNKKIKYSIFGVLYILFCVVALFFLIAPKQAEAFRARAMQEITKFAGYTYGLKVRRNPNVSYGAVIEHETTGVLNLSTNGTNIGDLRPTGITKTMVFDFGNDTFSTQWVPARADSDIGIRLNGDAILDSLSVLSTFGTGDTAIVRVYKTTSVATLISGPDTLVSGSAGYQTVSLTGVAAATRDIDISAGEYPAIQITEKGTLLQVSTVLYFREYDAQ